MRAKRKPRASGANCFNRFFYVGPRGLRRQALDGIETERSVFIANLPRFFVGRGTIRRHGRIQTREAVDDNARLGRRTLDSDDLAATDKGFAATIGERLYRKRGIFFEESFLIGYVDFRNDISRRLGLRMQSLDGRGSERRARNECDTDGWNLRP